MTSRWSSLFPATYTKTFGVNTINQEKEHSVIAKNDRLYVEITTYSNKPTKITCIANPFLIRKNDHREAFHKYIKNELGFGYASQHKYYCDVENNNETYQSKLAQTIGFIENMSPIVLRNFRLFYSTESIDS